VTGESVYAIASALNEFRKEVTIKIKQTKGKTENTEILLALGGGLMTGVHLAASINGGAQEEVAGESEDTLKVLPEGETIELKA